MLVTGVDIIEIARVKDVAERHGERFLRRVYTSGEVAYCRGRAPQLASRFAAKEAVMKALGDRHQRHRMARCGGSARPRGPPHNPAARSGPSGSRENGH